MMEFLLDFSNLPEFYTVYGSICLAIIHLIWIWNIEIKFISSNSTFQEKNYQTSPVQTKNREWQINDIISWITKFIRNKLNSLDDEDCIVCHSNTI